MNTATKWCAALAAAFVLCASPARAGNQEVRDIVLFRGGNTSAAVDTAELVTPWFSVRGASRVMLRIWSANTSAWTAADSIYADSLVTFKVLLSDSICCQVTGPTGLTIPSAGDSLMLDMAVATSNPDSARTLTTAFPLPINKALAGNKNGSGLTPYIFPSLHRAGAALVPDYPGVFGKGYMRIRMTALTRLTEGGRLSTAGIRTQGIRGLRMRALVYYPNK